MEALGIGEVARRTGMRESAIRFYENEGLISLGPRRHGRRSFDSAALARLQVIRTARQLGFSIEELRQLLLAFPADTPPPDRWRALAREKLPLIDAQIRRAFALKRMLQAGMNCQCVSVEDCFLDDCSKEARPLPVVNAC